MKKHRPWDLTYFLASGFGVGLLPFAPGTWGTLLAVLFYYLIRDLPLVYYGAVVVLAFGLGIWLCEAANERLGVHDHSSIVWDEMVGYWLTMIAMPHHLVWVLLGFLLFRLFDIWKPWPINKVDATLQNGLGIMLDDALAGIYASIILRLVILTMLHFKFGSFALFSL